MYLFLGRDTVGAYLDDPAMLARASRAVTKVIEDDRRSLKATQDLIRQTVGDLDLVR